MSGSDCGELDLGPASPGGPLEALDAAGIDGRLDDAGDGEAVAGG
ncbi:MAG TPA: hypothetical protein VLM17_05110 [Xanthomonadaceae bacterium]|nr:hypothetical protein [Xanthomonadaceae bacterium]